MISSKFDVTMASLPVPFQLLTTLVRRDVVGVLYHCVSDESVPHVEHIMPMKSVSQFENDIITLKSCFNPVSYEDVIAHRENAKPLPPRAMLLTVDDGFANAFSVIRPILKKHSVPAVFFVITDTLDNKFMADTHKKGLCNYCMGALGQRLAETLNLLNEYVPHAPREFQSFQRWLDDLTFRQQPYLDLVCDVLGADIQTYLTDHRPYMTRDQVRLLAREGFSVGAHSKSHRELWLLRDGPELEKEISESCAEICKITGESSAPFSFPYQSNHIPRQLLAQVREAHRHVGYMFDSHGFRKDKPFVISRQCFDNPIGADPAGSNFCLALRHAYMAQLYCSLTGRGSIE